MKKSQIAFVAVLLAGAASVAMAREPQPQGQPQRGGGGGRMMAALTQGITLTVEQQTKFDEIAKKYADARHALMQDQSVDQAARRAEMREGMAKQSDEIEALLTDDQKKVFEKNQADTQARMQQGGGQRPPEALAR